MKRKLLLLLILPLLILVIYGCNVNSEEKAENSDIETTVINEAPKIEYWMHTIQYEDVYYIYDDPYGYYQIVYDDPRLSGDYWYDVWFFADDGSLFRLAPVYDENISVWYYIIYLYDGSLVFNSGFDMSGVTMVIFRMMVEAVKGEPIEQRRIFDVRDYITVWPPEIKK